MQPNAKIIVLPKRLPAKAAHPGASSKGKYRANKLVVVLTMMFLVYATVTFVRQEMKLRELRQELQGVAAEQHQEIEEQARLKEDLEFAKSNEYIERVARDKLGYLREGDLFYITTDTIARKP